MSIKVIFLNNYFYIRGGSEAVFFNEMELLKLNGHGIVPFSRHFSKNLNSEYSQYYPSDFSYESGFFVKKVVTALKMIYSIESKNKFKMLINNIKPDIIHAHNIYGRLTYSVIDVAKTKKVPVVMTLHDYKLICPSYTMLLKGKPCEKCKGHYFYNCILTRCHKGSLSASTVYTLESYFNRYFKKYEWIRYLICPSKFSLKKHLEAGLPEEKLVHLPNFVKIEDYEPHYKSGDYILYVGRLSKEKGVLTLLKAIKGIDMQLKIVGDGPMREVCEKFVSENNLNNVQFLGYKSGEELKQLYRNAAFLIIPSECYENQPMTIIESFAYGKPMIGSNIGGIPEMIIDGQTGLLFEPGNDIELREKIVCLLSNPSIIENMGRKAREKAEIEYSSDIHYNKLIEIYQKTLSR